MSQPSNSGQAPPDQAASGAQGRGLEDRGGRGDQPVRCRAGERSRTARALREHAGGIQGHLADERRLLAAGRLRPGRRCRGGLRAHPGGCPGPGLPQPRPWAPALGPAVAAYTAALLCDTAVPTWHDGLREMPYLFAGSAASAAGGLGMLAVPAGQARQAARFALPGAAADFTAKKTHRIGVTAERHETGRAGALLQAADVLLAAGAAGAVLAGRSRAVSAIAGALPVAAPRPPPLAFAICAGKLNGRTSRGGHGVT
jgi:hypothetical protein